MFYELLLGWRLFLNIMTTFRWTTEEFHSTNEVTMTDYLENHLPQNFETIFEDGTYSEIKNKNTGQIFAVRAMGDGDSFNHKVEFEFIH